MVSIPPCLREPGNSLHWSHLAYQAGLPFFWPVFCSDNGRSCTSDFSWWFFTKPIWKICAYVKLDHEFPQENRVENSKNLWETPPPRNPVIFHQLIRIHPTHPRITWSSTSHFEQIFDDWMTRVLVKRASIRICCKRWNSQRAFLRRSNHFRRNEPSLQISGFFSLKSIFLSQFAAKKNVSNCYVFSGFFVVKIDIDLSPKDDNFIQLKGKIKFCSVFANCRAGNESKDTKKQKQLHDSFNGLYWSTKRK